MKSRKQRRHEKTAPSLRTIFAPFGVTDQYSQAIYHGGIFAYAFHHWWLKSLSNLHVTRGWLRGSQRRIDPEKSRPWRPYHPHDRREPLRPGEVYEFNIEIVPTGVLLRAGSRFGIRVKATDQDGVATDFLDNHAYGHLFRETTAEITVLHNNRYPSHLLVPITRGNRIGTYMSGGVMPPFPR